MYLFLSSLVAGMTIGSIFGLIGIGYTVIFNATRVFNLAQGDLVMAGIMMSYFVLDVLKWSEWSALFIVPIVVVLIAVFEERVAVRVHLKRPGATSFGWFISTLGFSLVVSTVVFLAFGSHAVVAIPSPLPIGGFNIGNSVIGYRQLLVIGTFVTVIILLELFYARTWMGKAMRGTAEDREAASLRGINPITMSRTAFALGGLIAGLAAFVVAPLTFSDPTVGLTYTLDGFLALAIGGFGSIRGAIAGGMLLGVGTQMFDLYIGAKFDVVAGLIILLVILTFRPEGLFRTSAGRMV
jgi:branched-chain amino acid transport system permease protein